MQETFESETSQIADFVSVLRRRLGYFIIPVIAIASATFVLAIAWPATYLSTVTIMVDNEELLDEIFLPTTKGSGAQRILAIQQQLLTTSRIEKIAEKLDLYASTPDLPIGNIVDAFRNDVLVEFVDEEIIDPRSGRPIETTIAFLVGFYSEDPATAQEVAGELATLFLEENERIRSASTASVSEFLEDRASALASELSARERELARFKEAYAGALPESYEYNRDVIERIDNQLVEVDRRLRDIERREIELTAELAQISPFSTITLPTGEVVMSDSERLRTLQSEYKRKSQKYSEAHPDLIRLKREIDALQATLGQRSDLSVGKPSGDHGQPDNPAYIFVSTQLQSVKSERSSLIRQREELQERVQKFEELVRRAPEVEREYQMLIRDYEAASATYAELRSKQVRADIARSAESGPQSDQFTVIEPANFPFIPESPNRIAILTLGVIVAIAVGIASVMMTELVDTSIRGAKALAAFAGTPPLVVVPYIENSSDIDKATMQRRLYYAGGIAAIIVLVSAFLFFAGPE